MSFSGVLRELFKLGAIPPRSRMECVDCGCRVKKHDKYKILAARHVNCLDSRLIGQTSLPIEVNNDQPEKESSPPSRIPGESLRTETT